MRKLALPFLLIALVTGCNLGIWTEVNLGSKAQELYLQGRSEWEKRTPQGLRQSLLLFEAAVEADEGMAEAHAGVADAAALLALYGVEPPQQMLPKALQSARAALRLDSGLASAHASLGLALYLYERDFQAAGESFKQAMGFDPAYLPARQWHAMMLIAQGHYRQAAKHFEDSLKYQPDSLLSHIKLGSAMAALGNSAQARHHFEEARRIAPTSSLLLRETALMELRRGRLNEALDIARQLSQAAPDDPANLAVLGHLLGRLGQTNRALEIVRRLESGHQEGYLPPTDLAQVLAGVGDLDAAFLKLEEALQENDPSIVYLKFKPTYDPLRADPRYRLLLARIGLPLPIEDD